MACRDSRIVPRHRGLDLGGRSATPLDCARRGDPHDGPVEFETRTLFKFDSQPRSSLTRVDIRCADRRDALLRTPPCSSSTPPPRPSSCVGASPHATHFVDVSHRASHILVLCDRYSRRMCCIPSASPRLSTFVNASPDAVGVASRRAITAASGRRGLVERRSHSGPAVDVFLVARGLNHTAAVAGWPPSRAASCRSPATRGATTTRRPGQ